MSASCPAVNGASGAVGDAAASLIAAAAPTAPVANVGVGNHALPDGGGTGPAASDALGTDLGRESPDGLGLLVGP